MPTIFLSDHAYTYAIQWQARKTMHLQLSAVDTLLIKAPKTISIANIILFMQEKASWIHKKNTLLQKTTDSSSHFNLYDGMPLLFKGDSLFLKLEISCCKPSINLAEKNLAVNLYKSQENQLPILLRQWYIKQATMLLIEKTHFWCNKVGIQVQQITIKDQKTRWGSCSSLGNINYNWRIIMAPEKVIDYLVVHEVSHRLFLNHSKQFWFLVGTYCPDYQIQRIWLKENGHLLFKIL